MKVWVPCAEDSFKGTIQDVDSHHEDRLNGRNFTEFLTLNAGTVSSPGAEAGSMREGKRTGHNINGNRTSNINYTLDGLINTDVTQGDPAVILSQDAIQEFKEQKPAHSAAYGFSSSQVNIISKSGTNNLHGSVFEFGRNDALDAQNLFATSKPELRQNQFGFVAGGPVYIPKVYNGRNKTFWLANYEGWRIRRGVISQGIVPDPSELNGNFSSLNLPSFGTPACNSALLLDQPCMPVAPTAGQPYSGDQIPSTDFSKLATQSLALKFFPAPNCAPAVCAGNNYRVNETLPTTFNQQTYKGVQDLGRLGKFFSGTRTAITAPARSARSLEPSATIILPKRKTVSASAGRLRSGQTRSTAFASAASGRPPISAARPSPNRLSRRSGLPGRSPISTPARDPHPGPSVSPILAASEDLPTTRRSVTCLPGSILTSFRGCMESTRCSSVSLTARGFRCGTLRPISWARSAIGTT